MFTPNKLKFISLFFIVLFAQIILSMIEGQIEDRANNRHFARESIKQSWTGDQKLLATIINIPYQREITTKFFNEELKRYENKIEWIDKRLSIFPKLLNIDSNLKHQILKRGIYDVPVYTADIDLNGVFVNTDIIKILNDPKTRMLENAFLSVGISDTRGISGNPILDFNGKKLEALPGTRHLLFPSGFHVPINVDKANESNSFDISFQLKGMGRLGFIPTAKQNYVSIKSDWPHPSFNGAFLPTSRQVTESGYTASWQTGSFASNIENVIRNCFDQICDELNNSDFGVNHIQAVDIYLQGLRSIKYGILIVMITFTIFLLYEVLNKGINIHLISYALTGMALAIFFLLLIALSEHMSFIFSYFISAILCSSLIAFYVKHLSGSNNHGLTMLGLLNGFYLVLYFIIRSEDHALLAGSILLFVLLSFVILITRNVNWYEMGKAKQLQ